ncbi:MAG: flagellar biosynthetic protein FliR [Rhodobacteraceae bacterium]|nr:flagellar biosynthetic protein FliR [Paracoccaceae bacterium]
MATLPAFGEQSVPARIRLVLALMFSAAIAPAVLPALQPVALVKGAFPEVAIGLTLGLGLRLFILALMTAGSIVANATSLSQLFPAGAEAQPAIAKLLVAAGLALAVQGGLALRVVDYLLLGYDLLPGGQWPSSSAITEFGVAQVGRAFSLAFMISMPFVIGSLLYNVALGVINRAMPQLMVSFIGAPALSLGGLVVLAMITPFVLSVWLEAFTAFLTDPIQRAP